MLKTLQFKEFEKEEYPFNIPCIQNIKTLDLSNKITVFVRDNGRGKSKLLKEYIKFCQLNDIFYVSVDASQAKNKTFNITSNIIKKLVLNSSDKLR